MRIAIALLGLALGGCAVGYQSGSKQFGWTIGPAAMLRTETQSAQGWCTNIDPIYEIIEEHRGN